MSDNRFKAIKRNDDNKLPVSVVEFLNYLTAIKGKSEKTSESYRKELGLFFRYIVHKKKNTENINNTDISKVDKRIIKSIELKDLHDFLNYCRDERNNSANARARKVATLKSYFNYLQNIAEIITKNPTVNLEKPDIPKRQPIYLTLEESMKVLTSLDKNNRDYYRNNCIFVILLNTGVRISELTGIKLEDIKGNLLKVIGKGNKERTIPLNNACIKAIKEYLNNRKEENLSDEEKKYLINLGTQGIEKMVKKAIVDAGVSNGEKLTPHKLRHSFATLQYKHGGTNIKELQELLGHENISTTQIYTHVDSESLKNAVDNNPLANF